MAASAYLDWLSRNLSRLPDRAPASYSDDAVLGYAVGCGVAEIAPFIRSLRAVFSGQVILIVDRKPTLLAWLSTHGVETVVAADRLLHWKPHAAVARFAVYAQILQERSEIRDVVLADVRDVLFQGDPFEAASDQLQFFLEPDTGADPAVHLRSVQSVIGNPLAQDLGRRPRVTVGVVSGPSAEATRFCRTMLLLCAIPRSAVGGGTGADQAACNVIAHLGLVGGEIRPNFERVATGAPGGTRGLRLEEGLVINPDGGVSPILNRYARVPDLAAYAEATWGIPAARPRVEGSLGRRMQTLGAAVMRGLPELR